METAPKEVSPKYKPPVSPTKRRPRHVGIYVSFILFCLAPIVIAAYYLYAIANDQYSSKLGFYVNSEESAQVSDFFGAFGGISGSSASDTDVLFEFIKSQQLIQNIDAEVDLKAIFSKPEYDPIFAFDPSGTIEDLQDYWRRMVKINYEPGTGLIEVLVRAFEPDDAQIIAQEILDRSSNKINQLTAIARSDTTKYAKIELEKAIDRLKLSRVGITNFRSKYQVIDPALDAQIQTATLTALKQDLSKTLIERELLRSNSVKEDTRLKQIEKEIKIIEAFIADERQKIGGGGGLTQGGEFASVMGEFERLTVDREFAEQNYITALASYDSALAEAQRQSRYLAAYILPTLAEKSLFPNRIGILALLSFLILGTWAVLLLIYYSLRDRK